MKKYKNFSIFFETAHSETEDIKSNKTGLLVATKIFTIDLSSLINESVDLVNSWTFDNFVVEEKQGGQSVPWFTNGLFNNSILFLNFLSMQYSFREPINEFFSEISKKTYDNDKQNYFLAINSPNGITQALTVYPSKAGTRNLFERAYIAAYAPFKKENEVGRRCINLIMQMNSILFGTTHALKPLSLTIRQKMTDKENDEIRYQIIWRLRNHFAHQNEFVKFNTKDFKNDEYLSATLKKETDFYWTKLVTREQSKSTSSDKPYSIEFLIKYLEFIKDWANRINKELDCNIYHFKLSSF